MDSYYPQPEDYVDDEAVESDAEEEEEDDEEEELDKNDINYGRRQKIFFRKKKNFWY